MNHLPIDAFTGDRLPLVMDFLDDDVSMQAHVPGSARRLLIHAMLLPGEMTASLFIEWEAQHSQARRP